MEDIKKERRWRGLCTDDGQGKLPGDDEYDLRGVGRVGTVERASLWLFDTSVTTGFRQLSWQGGNVVN